MTNIVMRLRMDELLHNAKVLILHAAEAVQNAHNSSDLEIACHEMRLANRAITLCNNFKFMIFENASCMGDMNKKTIEDDINSLIEIEKRALYKLFSKIKFITEDEIKRL